MGGGGRRVLVKWMGEKVERERKRNGRWTGWESQDGECCCCCCCYHVSAPE